MSSMTQGKVNKQVKPRLPPHLTIRATHSITSGYTLYCSHCDLSFTIELPCGVEAFLGKAQAFTTNHKDCEKP